MVERCNTLGMKPVCEHPSYCQGDARSLYIGQHSHLSYPGHRNNPSENAAGFTSIRDQWQGLCNYAGGHGSNRALCNTGSSHSWRYPTQHNPGFMCGKPGIEFQLEGARVATCTEVNECDANEYMA